MSYRWLPHTAEVELEIEALTAEAVFNEALHALAELVGGAPQGEPVRVGIVLTGHEPGALLVQWLDELVYRAEIEDLVPEDVDQIELAGHELRATVRCRRGSPRHLVKAATYHRLAFEATEHGFRATVVLDV
jgi:protein archease